MQRPARVGDLFFDQDGDLWSIDFLNVEQQTITARRYRDREKRLAKIPEFEATEIKVWQTPTEMIF